MAAPGGLAVECHCALQLIFARIESVVVADEWGLGGLAYGSSERILCGRKRPTSVNQPVWVQLDEYWNNLIAFYRARVEKVISQIKCHGWAKDTFRGPYAMLVALNEASIVMTALQIKRDFEAGHCIFEVVGPWPHNI